ncbi:MAG TPA: F0F1 ATP synthase subunit epsilon [Streptosporangiaceae bacterium]|nr:F0F1 ATP synthase subunit epsilon [Streptosporangiaceae bacterium]
MTLQVELVVPEGEIWSGPAELVIAKTLDGDIGVLTNHTPVLGILVEGSVVTIRPETRAENDSKSPGGEGRGGGSDIVAAVGGGFFAVADNRVSILAHEAQLGRQVDAAAARAALEKALQDAADSAGGDEEPADVRYFRALLRAAGEPDARA